ncbi:MAG: hypothetical protein AAFV46_15525, partial [Cyanobacteria bacterium J06635_11]
MSAVPKESESPIASDSLAASVPSSEGPVRPNILHDGVAPQTPSETPDLLSAAGEIGMPASTNGAAHNGNGLGNPATAGNNTAGIQGHAPNGAAPGPFTSKAAFNGAGVPLNARESASAAPFSVSNRISENQPQSGTAPVAYSGSSYREG